MRSFSRTGTKLRLQLGNAIAWGFASAQRLPRRRAIPVRRPSFPKLAWGAGAVAASILGLLIASTPAAASPPPEPHPQGPVTFADPVNDAQICDTGERVDDPRVDIVSISAEMTPSGTLISVHLRDSVEEARKSYSSAVSVQTKEGDSLLLEIHAGAERQGALDAGGSVIPGTESSVAIRGGAAVFTIPPSADEIFVRSSHMPTSTDRKRCDTAGPFKLPEPAAAPEEQPPPKILGADPRSLGLGSAVEVVVSVDNLGDNATFELLGAEGLGVEILGLEPGRPGSIRIRVAVGQDAKAGPLDGVVTNPDGEQDQAFVLAVVPQESGDGPILTAKVGFITCVSPTVVSPGYSGPLTIVGFNLAPPGMPVFRPDMGLSVKDVEAQPGGPSVITATLVVSKDAPPGTRDVGVIGWARIMPELNAITITDSQGTAPPPGEAWRLAPGEERPVTIGDREGVLFLGPNTRRLVRYPEESVIEVFSEHGRRIGFTSDARLRLSNPEGRPLHERETDLGLVIRPEGSGEGHDEGNEPGCGTRPGFGGGLGRGGDLWEVKAPRRLEDRYREHSVRHCQVDCQARPGQLQIPFGWHWKGQGPADRPPEAVFTARFRPEEQRPPVRGDWGFYRSGQTYVGPRRATLARHGFGPFRAPTHVLATNCSLFSHYRPYTLQYGNTYKPPYAGAGLGPGTPVFTLGGSGGPDGVSYVWGTWAEFKGYLPNRCLREVGP